MDEELNSSSMNITYKNIVGRDFHSQSDALIWMQVYQTCPMTPYPS